MSSSRPIAAAAFSAGVRSAESSRWCSPPSRCESQNSGFFDEAAQHDANLVQQRRAVDLFLEIGGVGFFQRGGDRFECREVGRERGGTEAPVVVIVARHAGLSGGHRIQMPIEIEKRLLDVAEAHAFSNRWHSSSDRTRSVCFAASKSVRHAASSSGSYP